MGYGLPYQGSKNGIAKWVMGYLPPAKHFYDLFAGGCAITHAAMLSGKYDAYHANDVNDSVQLFKDAIGGKYRNEKRWINREDFFRLKDSDPYVRLCWSFGNDSRTYLYGRPIEPYKKACWYAVMFGDFSLFRELCPDTCDAAMNALDGIADTKTRRIEIGRAIVKYLKANGTPDVFEGNPLYNSIKVKKDAKTRPKRMIRDAHLLQSLQSLQSLESLERLERLQRLQSLESLERLQRLQRLQSLESLERLQISMSDYQAVPIEKDSVIYCDIPYKGTKSYREDVFGAFDYERFYDWCERQQEMVIISEYAMPEDRFIPIGERVRRVGMCSSGSIKATEKLFIPIHQRGLYERIRPRVGLF